VKLCTIGEGTSEIQKLVIARQLPWEENNREMRLPLRKRPHRKKYDCAR